MDNSTFSNFSASADKIARDILANYSLKESRNKYLQNLAGDFTLYFGGIILWMGLLSNWRFLRLLRALPGPCAPRVIWCWMLRADCASLLFGLGHAWYFAMTREDMRQYGIALCKVHSFITYVVMTLANWLVCALCCVHVYVKTRALWPSERPLRRLVVALVVLAVILHADTLKTLDVGPDRSSMLDQSRSSCIFTSSKKYMFGRYMVTTILETFLPVLVVTICVCLLCLCKRAPREAVLLNGQKQWQCLCLAAGLLFLICTIPIALFELLTVLQLRMQWHLELTHAQWVLAMYVIRVLYYVQAAIKMPLCVALDAQVRAQLRGKGRPKTGPEECPLVAQQSRSLDERTITENVT